MSNMSRRLRWRAGVVIASMGVVATGLVVSISGPATAGTSPVPLDHFLCYHSTESGLKAPPNVLLKNAIQPAPFSPVFGAASTVCNPANKSVPVALFPAKFPESHLVCFVTKYAYKPVTVTLSNQFGKAVVKTTGGPNSLCLPSWKDAIAPPSMTPVQPPNLDHFTCYGIVPYSATSGSFVPPSFVKAEDEFSFPNYIRLSLGKANQLCVPTTKVASGVVFAPISPNDKSLVCFPSSPTPLWKTAYVQNQFGSGRMFPTSTGEQFCLPSSATIG